MKNILKEKIKDALLPVLCIAMEINFVQMLAL